MNFVTKFFTKLKRVRYIPDEAPDNPLIIRHYLLFKDREKTRKENAEEKRNFNIFIHKICQSDPTDLHNHPWNYFTLILWGGYWEETDKGLFWRGVGHFRFRKSNELHRLIIKEKPCWTLFIHFKKTQDWGFLRNGEIMPHEEYIRQGLNIPWKDVS